VAPVFIIIIAAVVGLVVLLDRKSVV